MKKLVAPLVALIPLVAALLVGFAPLPPPPPSQTVQFLSPVPVNSTWYNVQVVSPTSGAMYTEGQVAREVRGAKALPGLSKATVTVSYYWDADALGAENLSGQAFPLAFQRFCGGLELRIKPTRRFPATVVLGHSLGMAFQQYWLNVGAFDGALDCSGTSGESWPGYWWSYQTRTFEFTDPHVLARFMAGDPNDPGFVRLQFVGPPGGSDYSTWFGTDANGTDHPQQFDGHGWRHRWELVQVGLSATVRYDY